jgi:hypothetical protein
VDATAAGATTTFVWPGTDPTVMSAIRRTPYQVDVDSPPNSGR